MSASVMEDILAVVGTLSFRFAKTMPEQPHEYTVRAPDNEAAEQAYVVLFHAIQQHGVRQLAPSGKYRNRYLYPGDGWKYWAMTTAVWHSRIINRAKVLDGPAPAVRHEREMTQPLTSEELKVAYTLVRFLSGAWHRRLNGRLTFLQWQIGILTGLQVATLIKLVVH